MNEFNIYSFAAQTGALAISPMPGRSGDLAGDVRRILGWEPKLVLSVCERQELAGGALAKALRDAGVAWRIFTVRDFGVPDQDHLTLWREISTEVAGLLGQNARILIHCRGGCGRSGMAALRLMADSGMDPGDALRRLRAARPCAVETDAQMVWATGGVIDRAD